MANLTKTMFWLHLPWLVWKVTSALFRTRAYWEAFANGVITEDELDAHLRRELSEHRSR